MNAEKAIARLDAQARALQSLPERGRVVPELRRIGVLSYREVISRPWRIIYTITGGQVWIMAVLDGRRELAALLFERLALRSD
jgi:plasmid stabilization system protein ParE